MNRKRPAARRPARRMTAPAGVNGRAGQSSGVHRCRGEKWYTLRVRLRGPAAPAARLRLGFSDDEGWGAARVVEVVSVPGCAGEWIGWFETPPRAKFLELSAPDGATAAQIADVLIQASVERDAKCHPMANVPRWSTLRPASAPARIVLPESLAALCAGLGEAEVATVARVASKAELARLAQGAAVVVDPAWIATARLTLGALEQAAAGGTVIVDLASLAELLRRDAGVDVQVFVPSARHELTSARVEYSDAGTRGFALQDVFPYCSVTSEGLFEARVIQNSRAWKRYADAAAFATLLASETSMEKHGGDVLCAARPVGQGELIVTDLPWMLAGRDGSPVAPRVGMHALRMLLGRPLADSVQYWNRWDDTSVVVRDIADLSRRYWPLQPVRWAAADAEVARLGVRLGAPGAMRRLRIVTGRIDTGGFHDGLPAEPFMIAMKWLAREVREQTAWARKYLPGLEVVWEFESAVGLKYAVLYDAAAADELETRVVDLRAETDEHAIEFGAARRPIAAAVRELGVLGDGSVEFQAGLSDWLVGQVESLSARARR